MKGPPPQAGDAAGSESGSNFAQGGPLAFKPPNIPDHELLKVIGRGSYGEVWLARNIMGSYRAVKIVYRDAFENDRPYEREFAGIQKFEPVSRTHESQLNVLHIGCTQDSFFYVMELADDVTSGPLDSKIENFQTYRPKTLKTRIERGQIPVPECVEVGMALTTALNHLHRHGLVHRDIKPSNVVYVNGLPKLADIGLVCGFDATLSHVGTIGFTPPEGPGTTRADIYSLGKCLYEAATARDRQEFPELPTALLGGSQQDETLLEINEVLLKACDADPQDRYASAEAMHQDLLLLRNGESLVRIRATERRLIRIRNLAVAGAVAAFLGLTGYFYQSHQTTRVRRLAEENSRLADQLSALAEAHRKTAVQLHLSRADDYSNRQESGAALQSIAQSLLLVTNSAAQEKVQRIRMKFMLDSTPRLLTMLPHEGSVLMACYSPDGERIGTLRRPAEKQPAQVRIWDARNGQLLAGPFTPVTNARSLCFTKDGQEIVVRSCGDQGAMPFLPPEGSVALIEASTGRTEFKVEGIGRSELSPNNTYIAVGTTNNEVQLRDSRTGRVVKTLARLESFQKALTFSPDSTLLAAGCEDGTVRLWEVSSGRLVTSLSLELRVGWHAGTAHTNEQAAVQQIMFSPTGRRFITLSAARSDPAGHTTLRVWNTVTGRELGAPDDRKSDIRIALFDAFQGDRLLHSGREPIELTDDSSKRIVTEKDIEVRCAAFSPDLLHCAIGSVQGTAALWNIETGERLSPNLQHAGWVNSVSFSPDGSRLLTASDDGLVRVWDLTVQPDALPLLRVPEQIHAIDDDQEVTSRINVISTNGSRLILGGEQASVIDSKRLQLEARQSPRPEEGSFYGTAIDASGLQWASAPGCGNNVGSKHVATLWRQDKANLVESKLEHPAPVTGLRFSGDGSRLLTLAKDCIIRAWSTKDGQLLKEKAGAYFGALLSDSSGNIVGVLRRGEPLEIYDLNRDRQPLVVVPRELSPYTACLDSTGKRLATAEGQFGHIWSTDTGQEIVPPFKHFGDANWIEWSPDDKLLLSAGPSPEVKIWYAKTGKLRNSFRMLDGIGAVQVAHFSPDGTKVIARCGEKWLGVWDLATDQSLAPPIRHDDVIVSGIFAGPNRFITLSEPNTVRAFDLTPTQMDAEFLARYAELVRSDATQTKPNHEAVTALERSEALRGLSRQEPSFFEQSRSKLINFHLGNATATPRTLLEAESASFHLSQLRKIVPQMSAIAPVEERLRAMRIPPRQSDTPARLIDLSNHYNAALGMSWQRLWDDENNLAELPNGRQALDGVEYDLRGLIQVTAPEEPKTGAIKAPFLFPSNVRDIQVRMKATRLHFLHATEGDHGEHGLDGANVGHYVIHYADGAALEIPLIYGEDLRDFMTHDGETESISRAAVVWRGQNGFSRAYGQSIRLYALAWTNPFPGKMIDSLDFSAGRLQASPFLLAITADEP